MKGSGICLFLLMTLSTGAMAETIYVHDYLRLGIRANPNSTDVPIAVVTTGEALEVLDEQEGYYKVRAESGVEGWVSKSYVSDEMPARLKLEKLQKVYDTQQGELKTLRQQVEEKTQAIDEADKRVAELLDENGKLHQQVSEYYSANARGMKSYAWLYKFLGVVALFALGIYLGVRWERRRVAERLGGLEI